MNGPSQYIAARRTQAGLIMVTGMNFNHQFDEVDFDDRELEVLNFLSSEQNAYFTFQGLRRRLGLHQETLTRTLKRLEEANAIERSSEGYRIRAGSNDSFSFSVRTNQSFKQVIDAYLPAEIDVTFLYERLKGRWFSNFRWLGHSHDGQELSMSWISEDGQMQLQAHVTKGKITIGIGSTGALAETPRIAAAYQLFEHISKATEEIFQSHNSQAVAN
jgi:hypothetical protein